MKNSAKADNRRRKNFYKNLCRLQFFKYIIQNQNIPYNIRLFYKNLYVQNYKDFYTKIRNRCILTGRGRGVYRFCKVSRSILQEKALAGELLGFSKSSW